MRVQVGGKYILAIADLQNLGVVQLLVQPNHSCQWPFDFAPLGGAWCCFRLRLRLKGG
jgi:hypothetical protein